MAYGDFIALHRQGSFRASEALNQKGLAWGAEDVAIDALRRAVEKYNPEKGDFERFFWKLLRNRLRDFERHELKTIRGLDLNDAGEDWPAHGHSFLQSQLIAESVAEPAVDDEMKQLVEVALAKLDPFSAEVVRLHYCDGLTFEEIARAHNDGTSRLESIPLEHQPLKSTSLRSRANRALEKLRPIVMALRKKEL